MNVVIRAAITLLVLALAALPLTAAAQTQTPKLAPIPDMYVDSWEHHGSSFDITRSDSDPTAGTAIAYWRTYNTCGQDPPPCDSFIGNTLAGGGIAEIVLEHFEGSDDRELSGVVTATSDPKIYPWGSTVHFTMLPGNMLQETDPDGTSTMYCGANTDLSQYPPNPCGA